MADEEKDEKTTDEAPAAASPPSAPAVGEPEAAAEPGPVEPEAAAEPEAEAKAETAEPEAAAEEPEAEPEPEAEAAPEEAAEPSAEEPAAADEPAAAEVEPAAEEPAAPPAVSGPKKKRKRMPRALRHKHSKPERKPSAERKPILRTPKPEGEPGRRQERRGVVVSDKGDKTIVVKVEMVRAHPRYKKVVRRSNKLPAHDEANTAGIGDIVRIVETRPLSKTKRWRLAEIVQKAQ
jgi:small subunit ribosomal protein S17